MFFIVDLWTLLSADSIYEGGFSGATSLEIGSEIILKFPFHIEKGIFIPSYSRLPIEYRVRYVFPYTPHKSSEGFSSHIFSIKRLIIDPIIISSTHKISGNSFTCFFRR